MGISIPGPAELKMEDTIAWKDGIVDRLNKGVEALLNLSMDGLNSKMRRRSRSVKAKMLS
jgi:hypothetical protein